MVIDIEAAVIETPNKFDEQDCVDPSELSEEYKLDMDAMRPAWALNMRTNPDFR